MLYKKYRPRKVSDFVGIENVLNHLKDIPQCLCLEGPPGRGKSALAFCLAQIVICDEPEPCGSCPACQAPDSFIERVNSSDIDIAKMRDISSRYGSENPFLPGKRVLILEEFQELYKAKAAMNNALLLFEDLPDSVTVILTTMDSSKMNAALKRRFVMVGLPSIPDNVVRDYLIDILKKENREITESVIDVCHSIAKQSDGSLGVAISNLESYLATGEYVESNDTALMERVVQLYKRDYAAFEWIKDFDQKQAQAMRAYMTNAIIRSAKEVSPRYLYMFEELCNALDNYGIDSRDRWRALALRIFYK